MTLNIFNPGRKADTLTEVVFANRNKGYGAYELRRDYDQRVSKALLITVGSMALLLLFTVLLRRGIEPVIQNEPPVSPGNYKIIIPAFQKEKTAQKMQKVDVKTNTINYAVSKIDSIPQDVDTIVSTSATVTGLVTNNNIHDTGGGVIGGGETGNTLIIDSMANQVFIGVETMPEFPGGQEGLNKYLSKNINCRGLWQEEGNDGQIIFSLVVDRYGNVTDVKVEKDDVRFGCAEQAMKAIRNMPKWSPGKQNKLPVNVNFILPISYERN